MPTIADNPELRAQLVDQGNSSLTHGSNRSVDWKCPVGHEWPATVASRFISGNGCPYCSGLRPVPGESDLATVNPGLAAELSDQTLATSLTAASSRNVMWRCSSGHEWPATVASRSRGGNGCPYCSGRRPIPGVSDLATVNPHLASELKDPDQGEVLTCASDRTVVWVCGLGHEWEATVCSRSRQGSGCPYCAGNSVLVGFNDLNTTHPALAASLLDPNEGYTVSKGSDQVLSWRCDLGHEWDTPVSERVRGRGCPFCSGRRTVPFVTSLGAQFPTLAAELVEHDLAHTLMPQSNRRVEWRCHLGHIWPAPPSERVRGRGCPYCAGRKVLAGFNDLFTTHPGLSGSLVNGSIAHTVTAGSHKKVEWRCPEGHTWPAEIKSRVQGRGCPDCAVYGWDPGTPSLLYVLVHPGLGLFKVGIANVGSGRIGQFRAKGWRCVHARGFRTGTESRHLEQALLTRLRSSPSSDRQDIKMIADTQRLSGFTEMFDCAAAAWLPIELAFLVRSALGSDKHRETKAGR